nr:hypothetical protein [Tanacetum cinerariifolium]
MLRDYVLELQESNPNTTVKIHVQSEANHEVPTSVFKRIYVCLGPLKAGFKAGMRDLLGLDGAFMESPYLGQLLTAVSVDPTMLGDDLDLYRNSNFTFVSDMQKGIIPAIANLFPNAEHRYCVKHIHENMKKKWNGTAYKELLWRAAKSTAVPDFQLAMKALKEFSNEAYEWSNLIPPQHWSRSHFSVRAKSDVLLNNMYEVFNGKLVAGRDRPIIATLEFVREYLMKRCDGLLTPTATKILRSNSNEARKYIVDYAMDDLYQELTGIPCKHAVATNWVMSLNNEAGILEEWVHPCYRLDTWKKVYSFKIKPIRGRIHWPKCNVSTTLLPSKHQPQVGRPPKERKKLADERDVLKIVKNGSQSKKKATTQTARSATSTDKGKAPTCSQSKDKGKAPITTTGVPKKTSPRKKIIKLG